MKTRVYIFNEINYGNLQRGFLDAIAISLIFTPYFVNILYLSDSYVADYSR